MSVLVVSILLALAASAIAAASQVPGGHLLFIAVDDLRPQISGAYGQSTLTPNLLRLQEQGVSFTRAYTQVSLCSPSRTSFLTGIRPDTTRLWTIGPYFRNTTADAARIVTLPQAFKASGRTSTGAGKIWHPGTSSGGPAAWGGAVGGDDMPWSFSFTPQPGVDPRAQYWECDAWMNSTGQSAASAGVPGGQGCVTSPACVQCLQEYNGTDGYAVTVTPCADECYVDPLIAARVSADLSTFASEGTSFAYFAGFKRPHLGFQVPQWAYDLYPADVPIAAHRAPPPGFPPAGWWRNGEPDSLPDVKPWVEPNATYPGMLRDPEHAPLRRGYYAAVSLMDAQLGKVLDALESSGLRNSTWVVLVGDHGWSLGEHGNWAKQQLFEASLRVPFIIAPPSAPPGGDQWLRNATVGPADAFVEMVDLFPTLAELFGIGALVPPGQMQGRSLVSLLQPSTADGSVPTQSNFSAAFSQIVRADRPCEPPSAALTPRAVVAGDSDPPQLVQDRDAGAPNPPCAMGLSVRVPGWRYTVWVGFSYGADPGALAPANTTVGPDWGDVRGEELYDHRSDDAPAGDSSDPGNDFDLSELVNVAGQSAYAEEQRVLRVLLEGQFPGTALL